MCLRINLNLPSPWACPLSIQQDTYPNLLFGGSDDLQSTAAPIHMPCKGKDKLITDQDERNLVAQPGLPSLQPAGCSKTPDGAWAVGCSGSRQALD